MENSMKYIEVIRCENKGEINIYVIKDLKSNKEHLIKNVGKSLNKEELISYMNYCYLNYNKDTKGFVDFLEFEKEENNVFSLTKYKIYNYVGLVYSKLII